MMFKDYLNSDFIAMADTVTHNKNMAPMTAQIHPALGGFSLIFAVCCALSPR